MTRLREYASQVCTGLISREVRLKSDAIPYLLTNVSRKKLLNAILAESSVFFKPLRPLAWPTHLMVEPATHCNLKCSLCPVTSGLGRPQGMMEFDTFKKVVDEVGDYIFTLLFWGWGEPFLNPRAFDMIRYARSKGAKVISSTNGHLFAKKNYAEELIRSGIDTIIFAIDGVTQLSYERYRQGGNLETALNGIRTVVERKKAMGSTTPFVNFRFIVMAQNEDEIPLVKELAPTLGVDALTFKTLNPDNQDPYSPLSEETTGGSAFVPKERRYRRFQSDNKSEARIRRRSNPCKHLWTHPVIHWDGTVVSCSYDPCEQYPLGSLKDNTFKELWNGGAFRELRRQFKKNWAAMPRCGDCSYSWKGGSCSHETIAEAIFYGTETSNA